MYYIIMLILFSVSSIHAMDLSARCLAYAMSLSSAMRPPAVPLLVDSPEPQQSSSRETQKKLLLFESALRLLRYSEENNESYETFKVWSRSRFAWDERAHAMMIAGPRGVGKETTACALASDIGYEEHVVSAPSLIQRTSRETRDCLQQVLDESIEQGRALILTEFDSFFDAQSPKKGVDNLAVECMLANHYDTIRKWAVNHKCAMLAPVLICTVQDAKKLSHGILQRMRHQSTLEAPDQAMREDILRTSLQMARDHVHVAESAQEVISQIAARTEGFMPRVLSEYASLCEDAFHDEIRMNETSGNDWPLVLEKEHLIRGYELMKEYRKACSGEFDASDPC